MQHVAIMKKSWKLTEKILSGKKKIESRWYSSKIAPWDNIHAGDVVYFKDSGDPVTIRAEVEKVLQFSLNRDKVKEILMQYGHADGIAIQDIQKSYEKLKKKKYCILVFLRNPFKITPFNIDKTGFGNMAAWIAVEDINSIKIKIA
ncbi:hypothetical protein C4573_00640 [Candidatus Woesearchaeota archaeon]|nr:MAG: hypothetical protein C4573_00640 [Candidatus Woesearchaeota archaeon]